MLVSLPIRPPPPPPVCFFSLLSSKAATALLPPLQMAAVKPRCSSAPPPRHPLRYLHGLLILLWPCSLVSYPCETYPHTYFCSIKLMKTVLRQHVKAKAMSGHIATILLALWHYAMLPEDILQAFFWYLTCLAVWCERFTLPIALSYCKVKTVLLGQDYNCVFYSFPDHFKPSSFIILFVHCVYENELYSLLVKKMYSNPQRNVFEWGHCWITYC